MTLYDLVATMHFWHVVFVLKSVTPVQIVQYAVVMRAREVFTKKACTSPAAWQGVRKMATGNMVCCIQALNEGVLVRQPSNKEKTTIRVDSKLTSMKWSNQIRILNIHDSYLKHQLFTHPYLWQFMCKMGVSSIIACSTKYTRTVTNAATRV